MEKGSFESINTERMAEGMRVEMCVREEDSMRQWLEDGQGVWGGDGFWNLVNKGRCYKVLHVCGLKKISFAFVLLFGGFQASWGRSQAAVAEDAWGGDGGDEGSKESEYRLLFEVFAYKRGVGEVVC